MILFLRRLMLAAVLGTIALPAFALEPFTAQYQAYNKGKLVGNATMKVVQGENGHWQIDLSVKANRGFAGLLGLNVDQSTVFTVDGEQYRPLSQSTLKRAVFSKRTAVGTYDWGNMTAQWQGDLKKTRTAPLPLQQGDLSALLLNLAVVRDAGPGKTLSYRVTDLGRTREYHYAVAPESEIVAVDDLSYDAMRVERTNGGNDETLFWIADGVPTPVRILQREDGQDGIDLRLAEYQGVQ